MKFDPKIPFDNTQGRHHRRSIRLKGYDYRQAGGYFVTLVTQGREMLFGEVVNGEMVLNDAGEMIVRWWLELPNKFPNVNVDVFMPMPNHFHGIIFIEEPVGDGVGADPRVGPANCADKSPDAEIFTVAVPTPPAQPIPGDGIFPCNGGGYVDPPLRVRGDPRVAPNAPLSQIIQWYKTMTTNEYIRGVNQLGWKPFNGRVWQRNYYEHILRNETELDRITRYIESNPARWADDDENPEQNRPRTKDQ